jgi:parallel beta-helix repeat protein
MKRHIPLIFVVLMASLAALGTQLTPARLSPSFSVTASTRKHRAQGLVVTSAAESGPGSLRQALFSAQPGDTITFDPSVFPLAAPATITLVTPLPTLAQGNVTIDASGAGVVLDGSQLTGQDTHGLDISSDGNVVRGLEILNFPAAAVGLREGTRGNVIEDNLLSGTGSFGVGMWGTETTGNTIRNNRIGTDRSGLAAGNLSRDGIHIHQAGQNAISGNLIAGAGQSGIYICCGSSGNVVRDNTVGLAADGSTPLPNGQAGITIDQGAHATVIGPGNVIAHNPIGVSVIGADSVGNTLTQNRIFSNTAGISLVEGGNGERTPPTLIGFDLSAGTIEGVTCAHCTVEVFSTAGDQGDVYEGRTASDGVGYFSLEAGGAFAGPHLTATATDPAGNTSGFSRPTSGEGQGVDLQTDNTHPKTLIPASSASELAENQIGDQIGGLRTLIHTEGDAAHFLDYYERTGYKWTRLSLDPLDWSDVAEDPGLYSRWEVDPLHDAFITELADRGTTIIYCLVFWDEEIDPDQPFGWTRFEDDAEVQRYLDYVRFVVKHFKGRIAYYEIFNESFYGGPGDFSQQNITLEAYANLVYSATQVIREQDPSAKIIAGPAPAVYDRDCYDYELGILSSDLIMPVVDGVSWHPGPYPVELGGAVDHLYRVPETIREMQNTARAHGFTGDYIPEEIQWPTAANPSPTEPWNLYSETISAKYFGRGILDHRGLGMPALLAGTASAGDLAKMDVIRNLANLLAGVEPAPLPLRVQSALTDVVSYSFAYAGGDGYLLALWEDGFAADEIGSGTPLTLTVSGLTATLQLPARSDLLVTGQDVLHNFRQPLDAYLEDDALVIPNLQVRDYPLVVRLSPSQRVFLPVVLTNQH